MNATKAKGSGGNTPSGAPAASLRQPIATHTPPAVSDDDRIMTRAEVLAYFRIDEDTPDALAGIPTIVCGNVERYLFGQVVAWAALGGTKTRTPSRNQRGLP